jgi:hypothetical protein
LSRGVSRVDGHGLCEKCGNRFPYHLIHNGFNDSCHAYCDRCGRAAILSIGKLPDGLDLEVLSPLPTAIEDLLEPCDCGGRFRGSASPRCPACRAPLSPTEATHWIEQNAPGARFGWRWQRSWAGLYAIVIADHESVDPLRKADG